MALKRWLSIGPLSYNNYYLVFFQFKSSLMKFVCRPVRNIQCVNSVRIEVNRLILKMKHVMLVIALNRLWYVLCKILKSFVQKILQNIIYCKCVFSDFFSIRCFFCVHKLPRVKFKTDQFSKKKKMRSPTSKNIGQFKTAALICAWIILLLTCFVCPSEKFTQTFRVLYNVRCADNNSFKND